MENDVTITTTELYSLIKDQTKYNTLINVIFAGASIGYNNKDLNIDRDEIIATLKGLEPARYINKVETLKEEKKNATTSE